MAKIDVSDPKALKAAVESYLAVYPGELINALQLWYQGLGGEGVPNPGVTKRIQDAIADAPGWSDAGDLRDERFGVQRSFKNSNMKTVDSVGNLLIQHMFKKDGFYKEPDGKVLKIVTSEVWNLRCFEVVNGKQVGPMLRIHPLSDRAKALVETAP